MRALFLFLPGLPALPASAQITQLNSFGAAPDNATFIPPDPDGAVGPSDIFVALNTEFRAQSRTGALLSSVTPEAFWAAVTQPGSSVSDPHVVYDEDSGRFIICAVDFAHNAVLVGASQQSDTQHGWNLYAFQADPTLLADYPQMGFNKNWITVTLNMFDASDNFNSVKMFVFQKSQVVNGQSVTPIVNPSGFNGADGAFTLVPAVTYGSQPDLYLLDNQGFVSLPAHLRVSKLTGQASNPSWQLVGNVTAIPHVNPSNAVQKGSSILINVGDPRIMNAVYRNGNLWTTHAGSILPTTISTCAAYWYQIDPSGPSIVQDGSIADAGGTWYYYPSISVDDSTNVAIGFSASSANLFPGAYYAGRRFSDPLNTLSSPAQFQGGLQSYTKPDTNGRIRWGDFSATWTDPALPGAFWTLQEFSSGTATCGDSRGCFGAQWAEFTLDAPITTAPSGFTATTLGTSSITWTWGGINGAHSYNVYYATNPTVLIANTAPPSFTFTGLLANTTYALSVNAVNLRGQGPAGVSPTTSTLAAVPGAAAPAFTNVFVTSMTALWTSGGNAPGTVYHAEYSSSPAFAFGVVSSNTANTSLVMTGLDANTTYYVRVAAFNLVGAVTAFAATVSIPTLSLPPTPGASPFTTTTSMITADWTALPASPQSASCEGYRLDASTAADFSGTLFSNQTLNPGASQLTAGGLSASTVYYLRVGALNWNGLADYLLLPSTPTLPNVPGAASPAFSGIFLSSMTALWTSGGNGPGTLYHVDYSSSSGFAFNVGSANTASTSLLLTGLDANTTYYVRVAAINAVGAQSPFLYQSASTLANPPTTVPSPFLTVTSSITAQWGPLPLSPQSASCEGYQLDASTAADFSGYVTSSRVLDPAASVLAVAGLFGGTTYYVRVGALNWSGAADYVLLGSTVTPPPVVSSGSVDNQGVLTLTIGNVPCPLTGITVTVLPHTFPTGTVVSADATFYSVFLPNANSSEGEITPLSNDIGVVLSAQGNQPQRPVSIQMGYSTVCLPQSANPANFVIARFDDQQQLWSFLPTTVNTINQSLVTQTSHFSLFTPFLVTAAGTIDNVQIFPIPWELGSGDPRFDAQFLTFSNLPSGAEVKLYTILGELVWRAQAASDGILLWNGRNSHGTTVGTGTYLAVITAPDGGRPKVRRVTVIR